MATETRTFHKDPTSVYALPNDAPEQSRLDEQAEHVEKIMGGKFLQSPIEDGKGKRLLDVGCGTGYITDRLAADFPESEVFGLDISPAPHREGRPSNEHFLQGNILNQKPSAWSSHIGGPSLPQDEEAFDLIFSRFLIAGIHDWPLFFSKQFHLLRSGGWVESQELDPLVYDKAGKTTSENEEWYTVAEKDCAALGIEFGCATRARSRMEEIGFVNVTVNEFPLPLGGEGEETPELQAAGDFIGRTFPNVRELVYRRSVGRSREEQERLIADMRRAMAPEPGKHNKLIVTCGQKL